MYKATLLYKDGIKEIIYFKADKWIVKDEPEYFILGDISKIKIDRFKYDGIVIEKAGNKNE